MPLSPSSEYSRKQAVAAARMLLNAVNGDPAKIPQSYRDSLTINYGEGGGESYLHLIDKVEGEISDELLDAMSYTEGLDLPDDEAIVSIFSEAFMEADDDVFSFAEETGDLDSDMGAFLKAVIETVYTSGIDSVGDAAGNPPSKENNYLLSENGKSYSGLFNDGKEVFEFNIMETSPDKWGIEYKIRGMAVEN